MAELKTAEVPAFDHEVFAGDPVDTAGFPHADILSSDTVPVVVEHVDGGSNGQLHSISRIHGRSYVLHLPPEADSTDTEGVWQDQYGNGFSAVSTKGNNFSKPDIITSATAPSGYMPYGLQEGDSILRVVRASQVLRHAGVDTEWPIRIAQPKQLVFGSELVEPHRFKSLLLGHVAQRSTEGFNPESLSKVAEVIGGMEFYITYRAMSAAERINDMFSEQDPEMPLVQKAIRLYNRLAPRTPGTFEALGLPESLAPDDAEQYLGLVLPVLIGHNYGTLHEMGLVHGYPTQGNLNILGAIVDLDSVKGKALKLGDRDNSAQAITEDFGNLAANIFYSYPDLPEGVAPANIATTARLNFLRTYLAERKFSGSGPQKRVDLFEAIHRGFLGYQLYGSQEQEGLLSQIIPRAQEAIEESTGQLATEVIGTVTARELAEDIYWRQVDGQEGIVWEHAGLEAGIWTNDDYLVQGRLPTQEELERGLMRFLGADKGAGRAFESALIQVCVIPYLESKGCFVKDDRSARRLPADALQKLACSILGIEATPEHADSISGDTIRVMNEGIFEWTAQKFLPDYDAFWAEFKKLFRERHLEGGDLSIVPEQDLLTLPETVLEPYEHFWFYGHAGMERLYKNVPKATVEAYIADSGIAINKVATSKEVLQTEYVSQDCLRLMITDGSFDDYEEIFPDDEASNDPSYLQFFDSKQQHHDATYVIFLYKRKDGSFRMEYNTLKK